MDPELWPRVKEVFHATAERRAGERTAYLEEACAGDAELRREVERLLESDRRAEGFAEEPACKLAADLLAVAATARTPPVIGSRIGDYVAESEIGRGGMGTVYLASRADGRFEKRVALKLARPGWAGGEVLRRFRLERRFLAGLEHPSIARIHDAGATADGLPYFVMEYVDGLPIDRYCAENTLSLESRLELFQRVCDAVHHAHRNLVLHRDLKPANILVTAAGVPKLLDFGVAKWLDSDEPRAPATTRPWQRRLTPEYASPEQVRGEPLTTASDVYSLGVLLYELLTGRRPYRLEGTGARELERVVCEEEPERPSTAAKPTRGRGGPVPARLRRQLSGDLDNIVLTALNKDPRRRYGSADQMAEDVRRYRVGMPVLARGDGAWYRCGKFLRRHRWGTAFAAAAVVAGLGMSTLAIRAALVAEYAERQRARADTVTSFLLKLVGDVNPRGRDAGDVTLREFFETAAENVGQLGDPGLEASLMDVIGHVNTNFGQYDTAEPLLEEALEIRRDLHGEAHPDVAASLDRLGRLRRVRGDLDGAETLVRRALELRRGLLPAWHPELGDSLTNLGLLLGLRGRHREAEPLLREALELSRRSSDPEAVATAASNLAGGFFKLGELDSAETLYREALAIFERELEAGHPNRATVVQNLVMVLNEQGKHAEAVPLLGQTLAALRERLGTDHPDVAVNLINLGRASMEAGDPAGAESALREAVGILRRLVGDRHSLTASAVFGLASVLRDSGELEEAEALYRESLGARREGVGESHPSYAQSQVGLGILLTDTGRAAEAEPLLRAALEIRRKFPERPELAASAENALGGCLIALGRLEEAGTLLERSSPVLEEAYGPGHRVTQRARGRLARHCRASGGRVKDGSCVGASLGVDGP